MYRQKERGLACLEPLTGRSVPAEVRFDDLHVPHKGDLQDIRNRLGLLSPPCLRFVNLELHLKSTIDPQRQREMMNYLDKEYSKAALKNKPYYIDPYGRDLPGGPLQLLAVTNRRTITPPGVARGSPRDAKTIHQAQDLRDAVEEAKKRRKEQCQKDARMWGKEADDFFNSQYQSGPSAPIISPHLYQPRVLHTKSEWTKNMELTMAMSRKKDIQDVSIRHLVQHQQHGDAVRISKDEKDANTYEKFVKRMREKEEKIARFQRSKIKY